MLITLSAAVTGSSSYHYQSDFNSLPTWANVLLICVIGLATLGGIAVAIIAVVMQMKGKGTQIAFPAKTAKQVAQELNGTFMYGIGKVLQGSFGISGDHHGVREHYPDMGDNFRTTGWTMASITHYPDMGDNFPKLVGKKGVWVPLGLAPFSTGVNRYLLNVVSIPRPYGSLSAYELRYDNRVSDWHRVMVYDIAPATGTQNNPQVQADIMRLQLVMANSVFQNLPQTVQYEGHIILMLTDCTPAGLKHHYEALCTLEFGHSQGEIEAPPVRQRECEERWWFASAEWESVRPVPARMPFTIHLSMFAS